ncbi:helix-turn-helix domain-containing protein [Streptomyces synnematoformans]|uniref:Winged helix-turn-helix domain-containing protein n=1 Tax=Streptomyces synnematoformans TaxID=415721 RepID=A0ABN2XVX7_9ACTN
MLRIHFTDADLLKTRVAATPDPLWEVAISLHRLQTRRGRWAHAHWHRTVRTRLCATGTERSLRGLLLPLVPRAAYFPDFLTPPEAGEGLAAGLEAVLATPAQRVRHEVGRLAPTGTHLRRLARLSEPEARRDLVRALRAYHDTAIAPQHDRIQARIDAERAARARAMLHSGIEGVLASLGPCLSWRSPVLHAVYPEDRDLHLNGRGLLLVPSYFNMGNPVALGDATLAPVLTYSLHHEPAPAALPADLRGSGTPLARLLGQTRATVLRLSAGGATNGELARAIGISASSVSHHTTTLCESGLILSQRHGASVLHTLTPLGAATLRANPE